jgi:WD40 repeat protein
MVGLWDAQRYTTLGNIDLGTELASLVFTADGRQILLGDANGFLRWFGVASDSQLTTFSEHGAPVQGVAFAPDGASVATIGSDDHLRIWRATTGEPLGSFFVDATVNSRFHPSFSDDGRLIAAAHHHDGGVWDLGRRVLVNQLTTDDVIPYAESFDRRGRVAVSAMHGGGAPSRVRVWDLSTEQIVASRSFDRDAYDLSFGPDGLLAIATGLNVMVWDVDHDRIVWSADAKRSFDVDFSRDGRFVTASGDTGYIQVFDAHTGAVHRSIKQPTSKTEAVALSPDGSLLAAASGDDRIYVWDVEANQLAAVLSGHRNPVSGIAFSPDGTRLASAGYDGNAFVWALGRETRTPAELARTIAERVAFKLDGVELVSTKR